MQEIFTSNTPRITNNLKKARNTLLHAASTFALAGIMMLQPATGSLGSARGSFSQVLPATGAPVDSQYFAATGKSVRGAFLSMFNRFGLDRVGYPVSDERVENGRTVQYFERVRMEAHPESSSLGYPVLMGRLGAEMTQSAQFNKVAPFASSSDRAYMDATGHSVGGGFYSYWKANGGVQLFGYPISEEFQESGHTVQWFERARFEYHPELASTGRTVQLSLLGSMTYSAKADRTTPATASIVPAPAQPSAPQAQVQAPAPQQQKVVAAPASVSLTDVESYVLQTINDQRVAAGLAPVKLSAELTGIARSRSNDMATRNYFGHTTPEGKQFFGMMTDQNISYQFAGEILARNNYPDDQAGKVAMDSYLNSAPHRSVIMDGRYNYVGIGHAAVNGMQDFTVIFIQQ